jgi:hypothetical protein
MKQGGTTGQELSSREEIFIWGEYTTTRASLQQKRKLL